VWSSITDFIFLIDIVLVFRTSIMYQDDECFDAKIIAIEYIKTRFFIDIVSTIPFDIVFGGLVDESNIASLKLTSTLKLIRIARLSHIIKVMNIGKYQKTYFRLY
jgi:hypothetical protein